MGRPKKSGAGNNPAPGEVGALMGQQVQGESTAEVPMRQAEKLPVVQKARPMVNAESLIAVAIEKNVPLDSLERLLAMRRELKAEAAKEAYFDALSAFQSECPAIVKTHPVYEKNSDVIRYMYAAVEDAVDTARPFLNKFGFSYRWESTIVLAEAKVVSTCIVTHRAGHSEQSTIELPIDQSASMSIQQKVASARTFANRYSLLDGLGMVTVGEDDDGSGAWTGEEKKPAATPKAKPGVAVDQNGIKAAPAPAAAAPQQDAALKEAKDTLSATYRLCAQVYDEGWHPLFVDGTERPLTKIPAPEDPRGPFHRLFADIKLDSMANAAHSQVTDAKGMKKLNEEWLKALKNRLEGGLN